MERTRMSIAKMVQLPVRSVYYFVGVLVLVTVTLIDAALQVQRAISHES